ncbi:MAG: TetR/AcrR family transcriptional regulator [Solirubrobacteraceae bacterium]
MPAAKSRSPNPRGQGERLRAALLDAARDLLLELGDQSKLSVRAVTARAGVTPNALYLHFADKEALLSAVMTAGYKEFRTVLQAAIPPAAEPVDQLRAYARGYLEFADQHPGLYRVLFMTTIREGVPVPVRGGPTGEDEGVDAFNDFLAIVTRCLPDGPDPFTQSAYIWAGLHGLATLRQAIPTFPWPPEHGYVERLIEVHIPG